MLVCPRSVSPNSKMDRVLCEIKAALVQEDHDLIRKNFEFLRNSILKFRSSSVSVDVLDLCNKGVLNKCFSAYGCLPSSLSKDYIPIR